VVRKCTTCFKNNRPFGINHSIFAMEKCCIFFEVRSELLHNRRALFSKGLGTYQYQYQYEWGGRTRRPMHRDHFWSIMCPHLLYSSSIPVPLTKYTVSSISESHHSRLVPQKCFLSNEIWIHLKPSTCFCIFLVVHMYIGTWQLYEVVMMTFWHNGILCGDLVSLEQYAAGTERHNAATSWSSWPSWAIPKHTLEIQFF
jgi:hypothetical protein